MSFFWSSWVTVLSLACWLFIFGVLIWTLRTKPDLAEDETTGHVYDDTIREYDKPLPKWWLVVFFGTLFWGLGYFILYPAIQPQMWKGVTTVEVDGQQVPWSSSNELNSNLQANHKVFLSNFESVLENSDASGALPVLATLSELQAAQHKNDKPDPDLQTKIDEQVKALGPFVDKLMTSPEAQKMGNNLFLQNCALCHGSDAQGAVGYPNLTDNDWLFGGKAEDILLTVHHGRKGSMAAWQKQLGESGVRAVAEYVLQISGNQNGYELNQAQVTQGKAIFEANCVLCHGADAKGLTAMGAPNLTDDIWLFGGDRETVQTTIRHGRAGVMPEWQTKLGNERLMLLAAYVRSFSQTAE